MKVNVSNLIRMSIVAWLGQPMTLKEPCCCRCPFVLLPQTRGLISTAPCHNIFFIIYFAASLLLHTSVRIALPLNFYYQFISLSLIFKMNSCVMNRMPSIFYMYITSWLCKFSIFLKYVKGRDVIVIVILIFFLL